MKKIVIAFSLLLFSICCKATCIVIIIKKDTIYAAADSRSTFFFRDRSGKLMTKYKSICKINDYGSCVFAMAGYGDNVLPQKAEMHLSGSKNIYESWEDFLIVAQATLEEQFEKVRKLDMELFRQFKNRGDVSSFSIFGFRNGVAFLTTAYLGISSSEKESVVIKITESDRNIVILGIHDHLDKLTNLTKLPKFDKKNLISFVESNIKYEMKFHPEAIAPPIDLLKVTAKGNIWIRKKTCS
jgi:hypothetical protein